MATLAPALQAAVTAAAAETAWRTSTWRERWERREQRPWRDADFLEAIQADVFLLPHVPQALWPQAAAALVSLGTKEFHVMESLPPVLKRAWVWTRRMERINDWREAKLREAWKEHGMTSGTAAFFDAHPQVLEALLKAAMVPWADVPALCQAMCASSRQHVAAVALALHPGMAAAAGIWRPGDEHVPALVDAMMTGIRECEDDLPAILNAWHDHGVPQPLLHRGAKEVLRTNPARLADVPAKWRGDRELQETAVAAFRSDPERSPRRLHMLLQALDMNLRALLLEEVASAVQAKQLSAKTSVALLPPACLRARPELVWAAVAEAEPYIADMLRNARQMPPAVWTVGLLWRLWRRVNPAKHNLRAPWEELVASLPLPEGPQCPAPRDAGVGHAAASLEGTTAWYTCRDMGATLQEAPAGHGCEATEEQKQGEEQAPSPGESPMLQLVKASPSLLRVMHPADVAQSSALLALLPRQLRDGGVSTRASPLPMPLLEACLPHMAPAQVFELAHAGLLPCDIIPRAASQAAAGSTTLLPRIVALGSEAVRCLVAAQLLQTKEPLELLQAAVAALAPEALVVDEALVAAAVHLTAWQEFTYAEGRVHAQARFHWPSVYCAAWRAAFAAFPRQVTSLLALDPPPRFLLACDPVSGDGGGKQRGEEAPWRPYLLGASRRHLPEAWELCLPARLALLSEEPAALLQLPLHNHDAVVAHTAVTALATAMSSRLSGRPPRMQWTWLEGAARAGFRAADADAAPPQPRCASVPAWKRAVQWLVAAADDADSVWCERLPSLLLHSPLRMGLAPCRWSGRAPAAACVSTEQLREWLEEVKDDPLLARQLQQLPLLPMPERPFAVAAVTDTEDEGGGSSEEW